MKISDYGYDLPEELVAKEPPRVRGSTRLLVLDKSSGDIEHRFYAELDLFLRPGDVVVLNNTKVIKARLLAKNAAGKDRELLLLEEHGEHLLHRRRVIYRGKIRKGDILSVGDSEVLIEEVHEGGLAVISSQDNLLDLAEKSGTVPLPPYIHREATEQDEKRYQTVFAKDPGSVAAPTASLNFTDELRDRLIAKGVHIVYLTLHVGLGTFLPIRTDNIEDHIIHSEYFEIPAQTVAAIRQAKKEGRKILAVGTTVARTLEHAHRSILSHSAPPEKVQPSPDNANVISGEANIFIYPGYQFHIVDILLTNFHAPKSTVLILTAALAGWENLQPAYHEAIKQKYSLLSYGDSMLIL